MSGPLEGLRVLDLTRLQPGNYATMVMGDLGADVVKIEEPGRGDYVRWTPPMVGEYSAMHAVLNRNKRSVTLNLKNKKGPELLKGFAEKADVLIESFRPGVMDRLGVGYKSLSQVNPRLVYAAITGYGQEGPLRDAVGHDINYIGRAGILGTTGPSGGPPVLPSVQIADLGGAMMAVIGVLSALWRANSTGKGDFVDVSMLDVSLSWLALHVAPWFAGGPALERGAGFLNGWYPFYRVYECGDGKFLSVGAIEPQFWADLCRGTGHSELIPEQYAPPEQMKEIHKTFEATFATRTREEWMEVFGKLDACVGPVNDFAEMSADPQVIAREMISGQELPGGESMRTLGVAVRTLESPGALRLPAPGLGEHNADVYGELGLDEGDLSRLRADNVI